MSAWEAIGATDEWYTPKHVFDALGETFDLDVAAAHGGPRHVPCAAYLSPSQCGLSTPWCGSFVWMNPPFGGRNGLAPWLDKFFANGNGIALTPDRTSAPWWQDMEDMVSEWTLGMGARFRKEFSRRELRWSVDHQGRLFDMEDGFCQKDGGECTG